MSLLGNRLHTVSVARVRSTIWPLLVVAGLLTVPAECVRIGHPHSLFQGASAATAVSAEADTAPHSATGHEHAGPGIIPVWATPLGDLPTAPAPRATDAHPYPVATAPTSAVPTPPLPDDLPVVEPAAPAAIAAFGTALALIVVLTVLYVPERPRAVAMIAVLPGVLARALDPPPPRIRAVPC